MIGVVVAVLVILIAAVYLWGKMLPEEHVASVEETIALPPARVFETIRDVTRYTSWRGDVKNVQVVESGRWIEDGSNGKIPFRVTESAPPARLVVAIDTDQLAFDGTWTYELQPAEAGTRLRITERGRVKSPLFRALGKLFFPHDRTIRGFLANLKRSTASAG